MPLYGHEIPSRSIRIQAGLAFAVHLEGRAFPGREPGRRSRQTRRSRRVGLQLSGKRVPRQHSPSSDANRAAGRRGHQRHVLADAAMSDCHGVRSSLMSPNLGKELEVDIRGRRAPARVAKLPVLSNDFIRKDRRVKPEDLLYAKTHEWVHLTEERRRQDGHDRHFGIRRRATDRSGLHRIARSGSTT